MKCTKCGSEVAPNQAFCSTCGTPVKQQPAQGGAVNQNLGGQVEFNQPPKKKVGASILAIVIALLLIAAIIVGTVFLINKIKEDDDSSSSSSSRKKNNTDEDDDDDNIINNTISNNVKNDITNNTVTPSGNTSVYTVNFGSYTIKIPTDFIYKVSGNIVAITDEAETKLIRIQVNETPFSQMVSNKEQYVSKMRESGVSVNKVEEKTINGTQCLVFEITESGDNYIVAAVRINSMYTAICTIINEDYTTYDYDTLKTAISMAVTVEKSTGSTTTTTTTSNNNTANTSNMESKIKLDFDSIFE